MGTNSDKNGNGKTRLLIGLLVLASVVSVGTYYQVTQRIARNDVLTEVQAIAVEQAGMAKRTLEAVEALRRLIEQRWATMDAVTRIEAVERLIDERCPEPNRRRDGSP